ncbi:MAG: hypothetical protein KIT84_36350 [Labilithrix sp.]|nr:hypothetical protein [Labilithrix sp.]
MVCSCGAREADHPKKSRADAHVELETDCYAWGRHTSGETYEVRRDQEGSARSCGALARTGELVVTCADYTRLHSRACVLGEASSCACAASPSSAVVAGSDEFEAITCRSVGGATPCASNDAASSSKPESRCVDGKLVSCRCTDFGEREDCLAAAAMAAIPEVAGRLLRRGCDEETFNECYSDEDLARHARNNSPFPSPPRTRSSFTFRDAWQLALCEEGKTDYGCSGLLHHAETFREWDERARQHAADERARKQRERQREEQRRRAALEQARRRVQADLDAYQAAEAARAEAERQAASSEEGWRRMNEVRTQPAGSSEHRDVHIDVKPIESHPPPPVIEPPPRRVDPPRPHVQEPPKPCPPGPWSCAKQD